MDAAQHWVFFCTFQNRNLTKPKTENREILCSFPTAEAATKHSVVSSGNGRFFFVNHPPWNSVFSLPTSSVCPHCCSSCETKQDSLPLTGLLLSSICDDVAFLSLINWAWCFNTPVETFPQTIMWLDFILQQDNEPDHTSKISKKRERPGNLYGLLPEKHRLCLEETKLSNTRLCVVFQPDDADEREAETFQTFLSILPLRSCFCLPPSSSLTLSLGLSWESGRTLPLRACWCSSCNVITSSIT